MDSFPFRLLIQGYGLAGLCAVGLHAAGGGLWPAVGVFWIGGAFATLGLGALTAARQAPSARTPRKPGVEEAALHAALEKWEADRAADVSATPGRTDRRFGA